MKLHRRLQAERNQTQLAIVGAGMSGGDAYRKLWRMFERDLKALDKPRAEAVTECETPLSMADFERMMSEENDGC